MDEFALGRQKSIERRACKKLTMRSGWCSAFAVDGTVCYDTRFSKSLVLDGECDYGVNAC